MITTVGWTSINLKNELVEEDGSSRPLRASDIEFTHGKYKGRLLSEVTNIGYLRWMLETKHDDEFIQLIIGKRLKQLM